MYTDKITQAVAEAVKKVMDEELSAKQKGIAKIAGDKSKIDSADLSALRSGAKPVKENAFDYKSPRPIEPNGGAGKKQGTAYGGSKQKDKPGQDVDKMKKEEVEQINEVGDTPKGQKMLTKVQHRAVNRLTSKKADTDPKYAKKNQDTANAAWERMKEEVEQIDELSKDTLNSYVKKSFSDKEKDNYNTPQRQKGLRKATSRLYKEEEEQIDERHLTEPEMKKREEVAKSMKKGLAGFKARYGERAKSVLYATATKVAKEKA